MMKIGMLWYDDTLKRLATEKVARAAAYYAEKYGARPNTCHVHPSVLDGMQALEPSGMHLISDRGIQVNHFWVGVSEE